MKLKDQSRQRLHGGTAPGKHTTLVAKLPPATKGKARDKAGKAVGEITSAQRFASEAVISSIFDIPVKTLQKWRMLGKGPPARKFGGKTVRYDIRAVEEWANNQPELGGSQHQ